METQIEERKDMNLLAALTTENSIKGFFGSITSVGGAILVICGYISAIVGVVAGIIGLLVVIQSLKNARLENKIKTAELRRLEKN